MDTYVSLILMVIGSIGAYCMKEFIFERLNKIEDTLLHKVTEDEVRQILQDKLDPLKTDIHELSDKLDKIYTFLIHRNN